jgi:hypothetical protein
VQPAAVPPADDPPFAGSFIIHAAAAFLGVPNVPTLSFWTFTDVFEEPGFQSERGDVAGPGGSNFRTHLPAPVGRPWINTFGIQTK